MKYYMVLGFFCGLYTLFALCLKRLKTVWGVLPQALGNWSEGRWKQRPLAIRSKSELVVGNSSKI